MSYSGEKYTGFSAEQLNGFSTTVNSVAIKVLLTDSNGDILFATGVTVPTDTSSGYAKSCLFIDTDIASGTGSLYLNKGTNTSSIFSLVTQA